MVFYFLCYFSVVLTEQLNFPIISDEAVSAQLENVLQVFGGCYRLEGEGCSGLTDGVYDVKKLDEECLNGEDKELYTN